MMKSMLLLILTLLYVPYASAQQPEVSATYRPTKDNKIEVIWKSTLVNGTPFLEVRTQKTGEVERNFKIDSKDITDRKFNPPGPNAKEVIFTYNFEYGPDKTFSDNTTFATLKVGAFTGNEGSPTKIGTIPVTINFQGIKEYRDIVAENEKLKVNTSNSVKPTPASLLDKRITKITDQSITVSLTASQTIRVNALAYASANAPPKGTRTDYKAENIVLIQDQPKEFKMPAHHSTNYVLVIEEIGTETPARPLLREVIDRFNGAQIVTKSQAARPNIAPVGSPQPKRNNAVFVKADIPNATSVYAYVELLRQDAPPLKVSDEVPVPRSTAERAFANRFQTEIPVALIPGNNYKVMFRAWNNEMDESEATTLESVPFTGKNPILFKTVTLNIEGDKIQIVPVGATENIKTEVRVLANGKQLLTPCNNNQAALAPACPFGIIQLSTALVSSAVNPDPATTTSGPRQSTLTFDLTASADDDSERTQHATFALAVTEPKQTDNKAKQAWQKVLDFTKSTVQTGNENPSLESKHIKGTGVGGFFGALLRGFLMF